MLDRLKSLLGNKKGSVEENKTCILVVEDNEIDRKVVLKALQKKDFRVITADNGELGLSMAKSEMPNLIILDCEMPKMGGVEMCKRLREDDSTKEIPVVFLTSLDTPKNIVDCFELDAENYLSKPITPQLLYTQVEDVLNDNA